MRDVQCLTYLKRQIDLFLAVVEILYLKFELKKIVRPFKSVKIAEANVSTLFVVLVCRTVKCK